MSETGGCALKRLGTTELLEVTRLGLGTVPIGGFAAEVATADACETVRAAYDAGVRFFDTAPLYGHGRSEVRLGAALQDMARDSYMLATKVGRLLRADAPLHLPVSYEGKSLFEGEHDVNPVFDFSYDGAMRSIEESLERLQLDSIDVVHIHDPDDHYDEAMAGAYVAIEKLRSEGVIKAIGAGMNQSEMLTRLARDGDFDCFLLAGRYTLLDQSALDDLLPACEERGIALIAGGLFNSGVVLNANPGATYNYIPAPQDVIDRARRIDAVCRRHDVPVAAAAIQFPLAHPAVANALLGMRSVAEVSENVRLADMPIPSDLWAELISEGLLREDAPTPGDEVSAREQAL